MNWLGNKFRRLSLGILSLRKNEYREEHQEQKGSIPINPLQENCKNPVLRKRRLRRVGHVHRTKERISRPFSMVILQLTRGLGVDPPTYDTKTSASGTWKFFFPSCMLEGNCSDYCSRSRCHHHKRARKSRDGILRERSNCNCYNIFICSCCDRDPHSSIRLTNHKRRCTNHNSKKS